MKQLLILFALWIVAGSSYSQNLNFQDLTDYLTKPVKEVNDDLIKKGWKPRKVNQDTLGLTFSNWGYMANVTDTLPVALIYHYSKNNVPSLEYSFNSESDYLKALEFLFGAEMLGTKPRDGQMVTMFRKGNITYGVMARVNSNKPIKYTIGLVYNKPINQ